MTKNAELLSPEETKQTEDEVVLFVCTGNTCRSPMAAALYNHLYGSESCRATSAGLYASGEPISENAAVALLDRGIMPTPDNDYMAHVSRSVTSDIMDNSSLVVAMTSSHAMQLIMRYPAFASKVTVMPKDISDPFGGSTDDYRQCLSDIEEALREAFAAPSDMEDT